MADKFDTAVKIGKNYWHLSAASAHLHDPRLVQELPKEGPVQPSNDDKLQVSNSFVSFTGLTFYYSSMVGIRLVSPFVNHIECL